MSYYQSNLAYIHNEGFSEFANKAALGILNILEKNGIEKATLIDLGCGSGIFAKHFTDKGFKVIGIDISPSMIELAKKNAPLAEFIVESIYKVNLPNCDVVTSIGECFNYIFDQNNKIQLIEVATKIFNALNPKGFFIFDIVEPSLVNSKYMVKNFIEGKDWFVLVEKYANLEKTLLTRKIVTFRKNGDNYLRNDETHKLSLYKASDLATELRKIGFKVKIIKGYGDFRFNKGSVALLARKP